MTVSNNLSEAPDWPVACLSQAEICRDQARYAATMKRFRAAMGLFATAAALCSRVANFPGAGESLRASAAGALREINLEMATYAELLPAKDRHLPAAALI
jgi:hypothetical protein